MTDKKYLKINRCTIFDMMVRNKDYQEVYKEDDKYKTGLAMQKAFVKTEIVKYFNKIFKEYFNILNDDKMTCKITSKWNKSDYDKYIIIELDYTDSIYTNEYQLVSTLQEYMYNQVLKDTNQILHIETVNAWQI